MFDKFLQIFSIVGNIIIMIVLLKFCYNYSVGDMFDLPKMEFSHAAYLIFALSFFAPEYFSKYIN